MNSFFVRITALLVILSTLVATSCSNDGRVGEDPWDYLPEAYRDYDAIQTFAANLKEDYPMIVEVLSIGTSVDEYDIPAIVISGDPDNATQKEPRIRLTGGVHGNEFISIEVLLHFAEYLTSSYNSELPNAPVTKIVNDNYIVIIPVLNPDGYLARSRENANGIDLNRNCSVLHDPEGDGDPVQYFEPNVYDPPFIWDKITDHGDEPFSEPETAALKTFSENMIFHLSATFHSGATVINIPFDFATDSATENTPVEYDTVNQFGRTYGLAGDTPFKDQSGYLSMADEYGVVNGGDWYIANGSIQDWSYLNMGTLDITIELARSSPTTAAGIDAVYDFNEAALMDYITAASRGISGTVKDQDGNFLPGVSVYVKDANFDEDDDQKGDLVAKTDSTGWFHKLYYPLDYGTGKTLTLVFEKDLYGTVQVIAPELTDTVFSATLGDVTMTAE